MKVTASVGTWVHTETTSKCAFGIPFKSQWEMRTINLYAEGCNVLTANLFFLIQGRVSNSMLLHTSIKLYIQRNRPTC